MKTILAAIVTCALLGFPGISRAQSATADQLWQAAKQRYAQGDKAGAADLTRQAAQAGSLIATYEMGYMYQRGDGVPPSEEQAMRWYAAGAAKGCGQCDWAIGSRYNDEEQYGRALTYFKRGAQLGDSGSSYAVAQIYEYGLGVPLDLKAAVLWYQRAKAQGDPNAGERARNLLAMYCTFDDTFASVRERDLFDGQGPRLAPIGKTFTSMAQRIAWLQQNPGVDVNPQAEAKLRALDNQVIAAQQAREAAELQRQWDAMTPEQRAEVVGARQQIFHRWLRLQYWQSNHPGVSTSESGIP
jgi:hypothetical protein